MHQFLDLLRDIRDRGTLKPNRTGTDTIGVIGRQLRFDLRAGFPLETTRPIYIRALIHENLFFIGGHTNNMLLNAVDVNIWNKWAVTEDVTKREVLAKPVRAALLAVKLGIHRSEAESILHTKDREFEATYVPDVVNGNDDWRTGGERYLDELDIPATRDNVVVEKGELGPIYGFEWRHWRTSNGGEIDQLSEAIHMLRTNPYSRRIIISSWNPEDLPDESKSPQQNAAEGKQCLAACHTMFKFSVLPHAEGSDKTTRGVLYLHLFQRSLDTPVGGPYNIASYSMLLAMVAQVTNLEAGEFIWTIDDAHIYVDQLDLVDVQLTRTPTALPTLWLNPEIKEITDFTFDDIKVLDYNPVKPQLPYPVAV
jgi:thymidylate synthase